LSYVYCGKLYGLHGHVSLLKVKNKQKSPNIVHIEYHNWISVIQSQKVWLFINSLVLVVRCTLKCWLELHSLMHSTNLLRSRCMTSALNNFCHSFLSSAVLLSAIYFPFIRSLSRCILFLPRVTFPLVLPSVLAHSNDSHLSTCPNHTFAFSH